MESLLACIGFTAGNPDDLADIIEPLLTEARPLAGPGATGLRFWEDPNSGASLFAGLGAGGATEAILPGLVGGPRCQVRLNDLVRCDGPTFLDRLVITPVEKPGPLAVQVSDLAVTRPRLPFGAAAEMEMVFFAEGITVLEDEIAWNEWQSEHAVRHEIPHHLATSGLDRGAERPEALLTARIDRAEVRTNSASGAPFWFMEIRTGFGPASLVSPVTSPGPPASGQIVHAVSWVTGRVISGLIPAPRAKPIRLSGLRRPEGRRR